MHPRGTVQGMIAPLWCKSTLAGIGGQRWNPPISLLDIGMSDEGREQRDDGRKTSREHQTTKGSLSCRAGDPARGGWADEGGMMDFDRYGAQVGKRRYTYKQLKECFVCAKCGGVPVEFHIYDPDTRTMEHYAQCGNCGGREFIDGRKWQKSQAEAQEVLWGLPPEIAATLH